MKLNTKDLQIGQSVTGVSKKISLERMRGFSGWPSKNIHTDEEFAKASGLPGPVASGTMYEAYLVDRMLEWFGDEWITYGKLELVFIKMVLAEDVLTPKAKIISNQEGNTFREIQLEIWYENQKGEQVAKGKAFGRIKN